MGIGWLGDPVCDLWIDSPDPTPNEPRAPAGRPSRVPTPAPKDRPDRLVASIATVRIRGKRLRRSCVVPTNCCGSLPGGGGSDSGSGTLETCTHTWTWSGSSDAECTTDIPPRWFYQWVIDHFTFVLGGSIAQIVKTAQCVVDHPAADPTDPNAWNAPPLSACSILGGATLADFVALWLRYRDSICGPHDLGVDVKPPESFAVQSAKVRFRGRVLRRRCVIDPECLPCK